MKKFLGIFFVAMLGSAFGIVGYKVFFEKKSFAHSQSLPAVFSRYNQAEETTELPNFVGACDKARPAVVHIQSTFSGNGNSGADIFRDIFGDGGLDKRQTPQDGIASGSGVVISANGYIATNNHVIDGASELEVTLLDNRSFKAKLIGTDPSTDLALLKIEGDDLPYLEVGNSDDLKIGEWVIAIGNPMELTSTVTAGIVSAKGRDIRLLDGNYRIESFIQTDAVVNRGNSGGALINTKGDLIGINTAIASRTGYYSGYSFAIPAAIVKKVMEDLLQYGEVRRGILGIRIDNVNAKVAEEKGLSVLQGAYVAGVNGGSGAEKAGLKTGDVIVSIDGKSVNSSSELQEQIGRHRPGDKVTVKYLRGNDEKETTITLQSIEERSVALDNSEEEEEDNSSRGKAEKEEETAPLGEAKFRNLTSAEKSDLDVANGVKVEVPGAKLARGGVKKGFIITKVNGKPVSNPASLQKELDNTKGIIKIEGLYDRNTSIMFSFPW
ncbi:MAG: Do family serine endopeptidase [Bacteroidia bacterium]